MQRYYRLTVRRLAYVCRYAHIPLSEALHMDSLFLADFLEEVGAIVEEENRPRS